MFGFGKKPKPTPPQQPLGGFDVTLDEPNLDGMQFTDDDLNDPALLRELQSLMSPPSGSSQKKKPVQPQNPSRQQAQPKNDTVDWNHIENLTQDVEDAHVEITEDDLNNPHLLGELYELAGHAAVTHTEVSVAHDDVLTTHVDAVATNRSVSGNDDDISDLMQSMSINPQATLSFSKKQDDDSIQIPVENGEMKKDSVESLEADDELPLEYKLKTTDIQLLEKYVRLEKVKAATKSKSGDKEGARVSFRNFKELESRLTQLKNVKETVPPLLVPSNAPPPQLIDMSTPIKQRQTQYKQAALAYKKLNNMAKAKEMLIISKQLDDALEQAQMNLLSPNFQLPPAPVIDSAPPPLSASQAVAEPPRRTSVANAKKQPPPAEVQNSTSNSSLTNDLSPPSPSEPPAQTFSKMEVFFTNQINQCTSISGNFYKIGDKQNALHFHKMKKTFEADLATIKSAQIHQLTPPPFVFRDISFSSEKVFMEIAMTDMEIGIVRCIGLPSDADIYISWEIGWPSDGPNVAQGKGDSEVFKAANHSSMNFKKLIKIERTKAFQRFLERRKAAFEILQYRGFLRKPQSLGKAIVKLDDLLTKSEINECFELLDPSNRRPMGGKVELCLRLRQPLLKADVSSVTEKWLFLADSQISSPASTASSSIPSPATKPSTAVTSPPSSAAIPKETIPTPPTLKQATPSVVKSASKPDMANLNIKVVQQASPSATTTEDLDDLKLRFDNVDSIVSNDVLEQEKTRVEQQIAALKAKRQPVHEDLTDRQQQVEIKLQLLVIQVQTGKLTVPAYVAQLKRSIEDTKAMALAFKRASEMDYAKQALCRMKVMQDEVASVGEIEDS